LDFIKTEQNKKSLKELLKSYFGFDSFRNGQKEVIQKIVNQKSAAAIFPTGAGKSLCYQLPAMLMPHMTIVVSPLLSLMKDQLDFLTAHNLPAARLDSTLDRKTYVSILEKAKNGQLKILMISVERFRNERFRNYLQKMNISLLVVDEAHCISEWGHNFRPEYLKLPVYRKVYHIPQTLLLTATATHRVIRDMCEKFNISEDNAVIKGFYRSNLSLMVTSIQETEKKSRLLDRVREKPENPTIVYVTLQKTAEEIAIFLQKHNINARAYHAGMKNEDRENIQNRFMCGNIHCVVATIAFGMGIDKEDIRRIVHYDLPKSIENYSQEIGRSGRDGKQSLCEVLGNRDNVHILENFIYGDTPDRQCIYQLLCKVKQNQGVHWEIILYNLSYEANIRLLPLKTLLVYLDMEGIIRPRFTYFEEYKFEYKVNPKRIIEKFQGERRQFVETIINYCETKKKWTSVNIQRIIENYHTDRQRIITALEYFDEKEWIHLDAKRTVDVYEIMNQDFDVEITTDEIFHKFKTKEAHEIHRIHNMISLFESESCISRQLAGYFGEQLKEDCANCSFCKSGPVILKQTSELTTLFDYNIKKLSKDFMRISGENVSNNDLAKFLCGIFTPSFTRLKIKNLKYFGVLERYPFLEVRIWVDQNFL